MTFHAGLDVRELVFSEPALVFALVLAMLAVKSFAGTVGPRRALAYEGARLVLFRALDPVVSRSGHPLTKDKTGEGELVATVDSCLLDLARAMWAVGFRWQPLSNKKYIVQGGRRNYARLSVAVPDADGKQYHYYVFSVDGGLEVHGHHEDAPTGDPRGHLYDGQDDAVMAPELEAALKGFDHEVVGR